MGRFRQVFLGVLAGLVAGPLFAQDTADGPAPWPEFTFRRITAPTASETGPRINIQIGDEQATLAATETAPERPSNSIARESDWFWAEINPGLEFGAGRFQASMTLLQTSSEAANVRTMRADALLHVAEEHDATLLRATIGTRVSPALALAVIAVESSGISDATSSAGAQGLMQLIPATADRFNVEDAFDAVQNIQGGVAYLDWLMEEFDRDPLLVLAGYNAGEGAVRQANGVPDYPETRDYVVRVLATWRLTRMLCITPPELMTDGCVFRTMVAN